MRTALCLGGADCLEADVAAYTGPIDGVVACNEAGAWWPDRLDAWVTLHPEKFTGKPFWLKQREAKGYAPAARIGAHEQPKKHICPRLDLVTDFRFPGQKTSGSSGLFIAKVALVDLGFDRAVLCGVPMDDAPHFYGGEPWAHAKQHRTGWKQLAPEYRARIRSMSGWTRELLGGPDENRDDQG